MSDQASKPPADAGTNGVTPIQPGEPAFDFTNPASITWYVSAILTVLGFALHKDLSNYAGPVALGIFAVAGIAVGVLHQVKTRTYNNALMQYNQLRLDHYATVTQPRQWASHEAVWNTFHDVGDDVAALNLRLTTLEERLTPKKTAAKKTTTRRRAKQPPI